MSANRYNFFLFILCNAYNQLNIDNKLEFIVNYYITEKTEQAKRKYSEPFELTDTENDSDIESSGIFSSDSLCENHSKRQRTK
jgi:hypothetical protein